MAEGFRRRALASEFVSDLIMHGMTPELPAVLISECLYTCVQRHAVRVEVTRLLLSAKLIMVFIGGKRVAIDHTHTHTCLLYTSPSPRDILVSRMPSSA